MILLFNLLGMMNDVQSKCCFVLILIFFFCRDLFHVVIVLTIMFSHIDCFTINIFL